MPNSVDSCKKRRQIDEKQAIYACILTKSFRIKEGGIRRRRRIKVLDADRRRRSPLVIGSTDEQSVEEKCNAFSGDLKRSLVAQR